MSEPYTPLSYRKIFLFWLPLASTWLMMAVEGPFLAAVIARLPDATYNLAAYGIAYSLAFVFEAPIIMMTSASTRLVADQFAYRQLQRFSNALNIGVTIWIVLAVIPPLFDWLAISLLNLEPRVARLTHLACILFIPWPGAIGFRRFYQGILIRYGRPNLVAAGTVIRLLSMALTAALCYVYGALPGAIVGAASLSTGVIIEAVASYIMARSTVRQLATEPQADRELVSYGAISRFYFPLALTNLISLGAGPVVTFFMTQGRMPLESLAVFPVVGSLVFIFRTMGLSCLTLSISFLSETGRHYARLRNFVIAIGIGSSLLLGLIVLTPLSELWFVGLSGLEPDLGRFADGPARILMLIVPLSVLISFQKAVMITLRRTVQITLGTAVELTVIVLVLIGGIFYLDLISAIAGTLALVLGRLASTLYLMRPFTRAVSSLPN